MILIVALALLIAATAKAKRYPANTATANARIIQTVFGRYGTQAVQVARCESGLSIYARNGQYLGLFQMGTFARGRFGHSWDAWGQARAAFAYFRLAGYSWGPWTCKPW